jgi:hypothetical protein
VGHVAALAVVFQRRQSLLNEWSEKALQTGVEPDWSHFDRSWPSDSAPPASAAKQASRSKHAPRSGGR